MKLTRPNHDTAFTLIELLVVISIIAILAGIALPVFGEVQTRGAQTKALSNAKQVGLACKTRALDYNGEYPNGIDKNTPGSAIAVDANAALQTLIPDYLPDKSIFALQKSAFGKRPSSGAGQEDKLLAGENEWAYVIGLSDTSNSRFPLLADGFVPGSETSDPKYTNIETDAGGVWKGKKAVVIRVDISGTVEVCTKTYTVSKSESEPTKNLFTKDAGAKIPWLAGTTVNVLNPLAP